MGGEIGVGVILEPETEIQNTGYTLVVEKVRETALKVRIPKNVLAVLRLPKSSIRFTLAFPS